MRFFPQYTNPLFPNQNKDVYLDVPPITYPKKKVIHFTWKTTSNLNMETTYPA